MAQIETNRGPEIQLNGVPVIEFYPEDRKVRVLDVTLDVLPLPDDPLASRYIPKWETMKNRVCWDEPTVTLIRDLAVRLQSGSPTRLEGPTGVSKSFAVQVICAITNRGLIRHNYSKDTDIGDIIGRFVPSDGSISMRLEDLLVHKDMTDEGRAIIEGALKQSRSLGLYESKRIAQIIGFDHLNDDEQWRWHNGPLPGSAIYGSTYLADERNLAPGNVNERENSIQERNPLLRLDEHEGEVVRPLSAEEQSIVDNGGIIPGVIGLNQQFWYIAAQNPFGIGGGRYEESEASRNRLQDRIVDPLTVKQYEDYLQFLIKGDNPDVVINNRRFAGDKDVQTEYRDLEAMPNVDLIIKWLAGFQVDLQSLVEKGKIGVERDLRGGSYVYTRRNLDRFLDTIKGSQNALLNLNELFSTGKIEYNSNWHDLFMEALYQEYLSGMYREDQVIVKALLEASGIEDRLGPSLNTKTLPAWVKRAQKEGIEVMEGNGEWIIKKTDIRSTGAMVQIVQSEGYTISENGDTITAQRPLRSVMEIFAENKETDTASQQKNVTERRKYAKSGKKNKKK